MRYLLIDEVKAQLNRGRQVEQYLGEFYSDEFKCHRYLTIEKDKNEYIGFLFEVFDDRDEGVESIYHFSSIEPDDMYGVEYGGFDELADLLGSLKEKFEIDENKFLNSGYLDTELSED
ncbi:hypothetical protein [Flammeovirga sp. SJP92]|uniref:hypothetical protein n=1 Tax=Flammeovirga sp. SJP92 TaxID=1775430 RepID=UPI000787B9AB|nr:hypothetical protein [Flammeovirga sp. SJP92]KXX66934.1 hypothetical protein AVL50_29720 [Flammeovirga sp. SJP92]